MKKYFLTAMAAIALVSCQQDDLLNGQKTGYGDGAVGVNTFVNNGTRGVALNNTDDLINAGNGFDLFAFESDGNQFMGTASDGIEFAYNGGWDYVNAGEVKFWRQVAEGNTVNFYAVSPANTATLNIASDVQTIDYTVPALSADQKDLMYARTDEPIDPTDEDVINNGVHLDFYHALSQIVFKARTTDEYITAEVSEVEIVNLHNAGTFTLADAAFGDYATEYDPWEITSAADAAYLAEVDGTVTVNTAEDAESVVLTDSQTALLLLPQEVNGAASQDHTTAPSDGGTYIRVKCHVSYQGINDDAATTIYGDSSDAPADLFIPLSADWQAGYKYIYTLVFSKDIADPVTINEDLWVGPWYEDENNNQTLPGENNEEETTNPLYLNMNAADMFVGDEIEILMANSAYTRSGSELTFSSADEGIARINESGKIEAMAIGETTIYVSCEGYDDATVDINVLPTFKPVTLSTPIQTSSIQAGTYTMGLDYTTNAEYIQEAMAHNVTINDNFHIGQFEVTIGQYVEFLNGNSEVLTVLDQYEYEENGNISYISAVVYSYISDEVTHYIPLCGLEVNHIEGSTIGSLTVADEYKNLPIVCSWEGAAAFANSVGGYLPHEEEWEYAAKAGVSGKPIWWENDIVADGQFVYLESNPAYTTIDELKVAILAYENMEIEDLTDEANPVKTFALRNVGAGNKANPWGLYDLLGNVQEWCGNYDYDYELNIPDEVNHVVRGRVPTLMFWQNDNCVQLGEYLGVAFRNVNTGMNETGFRIAFKGDYSGSNMSVQ